MELNQLSLCCNLQLKQAGTCAINRQENQHQIGRGKSSSIGHQQSAQGLTMGRYSPGSSAKHLPSSLSKFLTSCRSTMIFFLSSKSASLPHFLRSVSFLRVHDQIQLSNLLPPVFALLYLTRSVVNPQKFLKLELCFSARDLLRDRLCAAAVGWRVGDIDLALCAQAKISV